MRILYVVSTHKFFKVKDMTHNIIGHTFVSFFYRFTYILYGLTYKKYNVFFPIQSISLFDLNMICTCQHNSLPPLPTTNTTKIMFQNVHKLSKRFHTFAKPTSSAHCSVQCVCCLLQCGAKSLRLKLKTVSQTMVDSEMVALTKNLNVQRLRSCSHVHFIEQSR